MATLGDAGLLAEGRARPPDAMAFGEALVLLRRALCWFKASGKHGARLDGLAVFGRWR
jgi:hypothetical protein